MAGKNCGKFKRKKSTKNQFLILIFFHHFSFLLNIFFNKEMEIPIYVENTVVGKPNVVAEMSSGRAPLRGLLTPLKDVGNVARANTSSATSKTTNFVLVGNELGEESGKRQKKKQKKHDGMRNRRVSFSSTLTTVHTFKKPLDSQGLQRSATDLQRYFLLLLSENSFLVYSFLLFFSQSWR